MVRSATGVPAPDVLDLELEQISDRYAILRHGGGGEPTTLICGAVRFDHPAAGNLIDTLPATLRIEGFNAPENDLDPEHAAAHGR